MDPTRFARLSMAPQPQQPPYILSSPADTQWSSGAGSATSESLVASPLEPQTDTANFFASHSNLHHELPTSPTEPEKRKRGRPRKHPIVQVKPKNGRSRTGCITCRKRKKKCDETKPECLNCQHMNKVCEGFFLPERWQSGRQKQEAPTQTLPKLINGVENGADRMLLDHFTLNLSQSLCLWDGQKSPFDTVIVPLALNDLALMHAILCLSASQLADGSVKSQIPDSARSGVVERRHHHLDRALVLLREKLSKISQGPEGSHVYDDATIATIAILFMRSMVVGDVRGEQLLHLNAGYKSLGLEEDSEHSSSNSEFREYMAEFFTYHNIACSITSAKHEHSPEIDETFDLPSFVPSAAGSYLGVLDGLFVNISKINNLRSRIRKRRSEALEPVVDSQSLHAAQVIDVELQEWINSQPDDTPRALVSRLYRQCTWIYLYRTIYHRRPSASLTRAVNDGLSLLDRISEDETVYPVLLMPVFLLGCAAFEPEHRVGVESALDLLETKRGTGNIRHVRSVVQKVWQMIDNEEADSWDWESLMEQMDLNFLVS